MKAHQTRNVPQCGHLWCDFIKLCGRFILNVYAVHFAETIVKISVYYLFVCFCLFQISYYRLKGFLLWHHGLTVLGNVACYCLIILYRD